MKSITVFLSLLFYFQTCQAQNTGNVTSKEIRPKVNISNIYFYQPPKYLAIADSLEALIAFKGKLRFTCKYIPLIKVGNKYRFAFTAPDSVAILLITIVDAKVNLSEYSPFMAIKKKVIDNNNGSGFLVHMDVKKDNRLPNAGIQLAELLTNWSYYMDLPEPSNASLIGMYESDYKKNLELEKENSYIDYLGVLYDEKKDSVKAILLNYATSKILQQSTEGDLLNAARIYGLLKMSEEKQNLENKILHTFLDGQLAKGKFWSQQYEYKPNKKETEQSILAEMKGYISQFKDTTKNDFFYGKIVSLLFDTTDWNSGLKYQELVSAKSTNAYTNNKYAKKLADPEIDNPGKNLEVALMLSRKALKYSEEKKSLAKGKPEANILGDYYIYLNTYALVLYKFKKYDSAFYYQEMMYRKNDVLNTEGLERYAAYTEKVKGLDYTKEFLEKQLIRGINSPKMLAQLQRVYKLLNLPKDRFTNLQKENNMLVEKKNTASIKKKLGTTTAPDFQLKNLLGDDVSLSTYKNKVVILDFWATWCAPCKASFPGMQKLVTKYKNDTDVVFLFIDVWETKEHLKVKEIISDFIKENNYSFNVLFDEKNKVVSDYKIFSIPNKFVIDKKGYVVFMSEDLNGLTDISSVIEAAKNKENSP